MSLQEMKADLKLLRQRVEKMPLDNTMRTLVNEELVGIVEGVIEETLEAMSRLGNQVQENTDMIVSMIEDTDDLIQPALSAQIINTLQIGMAICELLENEENPIANDLTAKRLKDAIHAYKRQAIATTEAVLEVTLSDDDGDDEEADTPLEIPRRKKDVKEDENEDEEEDDDAGSEHDYYGDEEEAAEALDAES